MVIRLPSFLIQSLESYCDAISLCIISLISALLGQQGARTRISGGLSRSSPWLRIVLSLVVKDSAMRRDDMSYVELGVRNSIVDGRDSQVACQLHYSGLQLPRSSWHARCSLLQDVFFKTNLLSNCGISWQLRLRLSLNSVPIPHMILDHEVTPSNTFSLFTSTALYKTTIMGVLQSMGDDIIIAETYLACSTTLRSPLEVVINMCTCRKPCRIFSWKRNIETYSTKLTLQATVALVSVFVNNELRSSGIVLVREFD